MIRRSARVRQRRTGRAQQAVDITRDRLHIYAGGYQDPTGQWADVLEVLNLDEKGKTARELVNDFLLSEIKDKVTAAGEDLRANRLPRLPHCAVHATIAIWSACAGPASDGEYRSFYRSVLRWA
jgi:hypothetical protein